jgi:hypothetical protein
MGEPCRFFGHFPPNGVDFFKMMGVRLQKFALIPGKIAWGVFASWELLPFWEIFVPGKKNLRRFTGVRQENMTRHGANQAPKERPLALCAHAPHSPSCPPRRRPVFWRPAHRKIFCAFFQKRLAI